jgi:Mrp family chromosome partitioning ATPase
LADLRRMTPTQRRRFGVGLGKLARDYDLVVVDGGSLTDDQAVAALTSVATVVVPVAPPHADLNEASSRVLGALGTGIDQMPGAVVAAARA